MNFIDNTYILKYHLNKINEAGINSVKALGWNTREGQRARFDVLAQAGNMNNCTILDVGCGTGDLLPFLNARYTNFTYTGLDINEHFLDIAAERYHDWPRTQFLLADISEAAIPPADYILASGALSYHSSEEGHIYKLIKKLYNSAHKALAFNLLASLTEPAPLLCTYNPDEIKSFCLTLSPDVTVMQGYWEGDFMVRVIH